MSEAPINPHEPTSSITPGAVTLNWRDFSLLAWDNSNALYAPSATTFLITVGATTRSSATVSIVGASQDISTAFATATQPPSAIGAVQVSNTPSASGKVLTSTSTTTAAWS
jgi:hypothetical protein